MKNETLQSKKINSSDKLYRCITVSCDTTIQDDTVPRPEKNLHLLVDNRGMALHLNLDLYHNKPGVSAKTTPFNQ
jgi:hypothetical protein